MTSETIFELIEAGDPTAIEALLDREPEAIQVRNDQGVSPLLFACYQMRQDVAEMLADRVGALDIFEAAALGRVESLRQLAGSDEGSVNRKSPDGFAPLHLAAFFRQPEAVQRLLELGADANAESSNGSGLKPINSAAASGVVESVRLLLEAGAEVDSRQAGGFTALHAAALHGNGEMVELLLEAGADPQAATDDGRRSTELAHKWPDIISRLERGGTDL